jgi:hypothetical protein
MELSVDLLCTAQNEKIPQNSLKLYCGIREDALNHE